MTRIAREIRKGRKYDQVIEGAREIFLKDGYEGANVDDIARAANVSKATLYAYFPTKEALFIHVAIDECRCQAQAANAAIDRSRSAGAVLGEAARHLIRFNLSDFGQSTFRICVAESGRFPELGQMYYETGPGNVWRLVAGYLQEATARGDLSIAEEEIELAAFQFIELCRAGAFQKRLFRVQNEFSDAEIDSICDSAVTTFLARYRA